MRYILQFSEASFKLNWTKLFMIIYRLQSSNMLPNVMTLFKSWKLTLITYILEFDQKYHSYCTLMTHTQKNYWYGKKKKKDKKKTA